MKSKVLNASDAMLNDWAYIAKVLLRVARLRDGSAHISQHVVAAIQFSILTITPAKLTFDSSFVELWTSVHMTRLVHFMTNKHTTRKKSLAMLAYAEH